jgi:hypothetical protein
MTGQNFPLSSPSLLSLLFLNFYLNFYVIEMNFVDRIVKLRKLQGPNEAKETL